MSAPSLSLFAGGVYRCVLPGAPRTKKNSSRVLKMGTRNKVVPSKAWIEWRDFVKAEFRRQGVVVPRIAFPCFCTALIYRDARRGDSHGYYNGIADVLQDLGVVVNDGLIEHWDGSRMLVDHQFPRTEVTLTAI